ncbi:hypothetical protein [Marinomonas epiphytica]
MSSETESYNESTASESILWNSVQLQMQAYRYVDFLRELEWQDRPLNGAGYYQYDLLMSRVDILRQGEVGAVIRSYPEGKAFRLLNIINAELELLSLNVARLENHKSDNGQILQDRIQSLYGPINEFVLEVHQANRHKSSHVYLALKKGLSEIKALTFIVSILSTLTLTLILVKLARRAS